MKINEDLQVNAKSNCLEGKTIAVCVTGGIAAIEAPKLIRELRRFGAEVSVYTTPTATRFIGIDALEWASGTPVISGLSGLAEHICQEDLVLVAPAVFNTINKICNGIADNSVTTLMASALGKKTPILFVPTMHESMYQNPILKESLEKAQKWGIQVIPPLEEEGKAKFPAIETIVAQVARSLSSSNLKGKKVLVTGGTTPGKVDNIRILTNRFTGRLAIEMSKELYLRGANPTLLIHESPITVPSYINSHRHSYYEDYEQNVFKFLNDGFDIGIFSAAVADFIPKEVTEGKISSQSTWQEIPLKPTNKVIEMVRERYSELTMVTFKFESGITFEQLAEIAEKRIHGKGYQYVVANREEEMTKQHIAHIFSKRGKLGEFSGKLGIARGVCDCLEE